MNRKIVTLLLPLTFLAISMIMAVPVRADPCHPIAEGCGCMKVGCMCVHGPAELGVDDYDAVIWIWEDCIEYRRSWTVEKHCVFSCYEVYVCDSECYGRLVIIIRGSRVVAFGRGVFFYGHLI